MPIVDLTIMELQGTYAGFGVEGSFPWPCFDLVYRHFLSYWFAF